MRRSNAGVTLVEVLVVLVLTGIMAGAVGLALGPADRSDVLKREATLLSARLSRAADEALLTGSAMAFVWDPNGYRFEVRVGQDWTPHPVSLLARSHALAGARLSNELKEDSGRFEVSTNLLPVEEKPLVVRLRDNRDNGIQVTFDGLNAMQEIVR